MVNDRLGIEGELQAIGQFTVLMPTVLTRYRPTVSECWGKGPCASRGSRHGAFRSTTALEHEAAVPFSVRRQTHFEPRAVGKAVDADPLIDDALDLTMVRQRHVICRCGATRVPSGERDLGWCDREVSDVCKVGACSFGIGSILLANARA